MAIRSQDISAGFLVSPLSGAATVLAANAPVWSLRNISTTRSLLITRVQVGFATTTAFTNAQALLYQLFFARGFTASDTAGTAVALTANQNKARTSLATLNSVNMQICTAAALTAGTRTLDAVALASAIGTVGTVGTTMPMTTLYQHDSDDYPLFLAQDEGLVIQSAIVMGAVGVGNITVNIAFSEFVSYT